MADTKKPTEELTMEQRVQHNAVMNVAAHNLSLVIDQLETLKHDRYSSVLESLDSAEKELSKLQEEE